MLLMILLVGTSVISSPLALENIEHKYSHPFHVSVAEIEYNPQSKCLEVALKVWPEDLEKALEKQLGKPVDLDKTPNLEKRIFEYLKKHIHVSKDGKKACQLNWIGQELEIKHAWLYFEVATDVLPDKFHFSNTIFIELQDDQVNIFNMKFKKKRASVSFTKEKPSHQLSEKDFVPVRNPFAK